jgi:hypothetical protein
MKFKLGLLLGASGGYLVGSGQARQLWDKVMASTNHKHRSTSTLATEPEVDTIIVDMTAAPVASTRR